ncbi:MAG: sigma-70 family RNA polymerase sigma factor [Tetrasphaera sp.]|nr:sigma-70 family RNA polymerase sigma factor [Tetrasphaera sp.]
MRLPPFQELVDAHWREVARLAHALAGPNSGDDVAQQAWTQALAAYPRVRRADNLRAWLLTITHRCAMDHHRAASRVTPVAEPPEHPTSAALSTTAPGEPAPELWDRVAQLPPRQREVVALRFVGDLDHASIAAALGISSAMSRRVLSDALAALRLEREDLR